MAASTKGEERRPAQSAAETRVGDVNRDLETQTSATDLVDGIDEATKDQIVYATTTRERTTVSKRQHEPLDPSLADDDQPAEEGNGPRAKEIGPSGNVSPKTDNTVSEAQIKKGSEVAGAPSSTA